METEVGQQFTRLVGFALPRWLRHSVHLVDLCDTLHVALPAGAEGAVPNIGLTVTCAAAMVLDACDAAHQAGDGRALDSWRQLLYDVASYGWVRDALDELRPPGRQAAGCWHRRDWEPAGPSHGTPGATHGTALGPTVGTVQGPSHRTPPGPTHGTAPGAPVAMGDADGGEGAGGGGGRNEGEGREQGRGGGEEPAAVEASGWREGVPACVLPPPCEAWRVLPTCCYPLCTNLEGDSEADVPLRVWGPGAGTGAGAGLEGGGKRGGGAGGGGGGGGVKGCMEDGTGTWQSCDRGQGGGGQLYCSRQCYVAHAVYLRTRQVAEKGHRAKLQEGA